MKVGLIGAGRMGLPIARQLLAAGHDLTVLVRRAETRAAVQEHGLRCVDTVTAAVRDADVVLSVLLRDDQVRQVFVEQAFDAMKPGATIVQHTTCDPATLTLLASAAAKRGVRVLDAALSGGPHDIVSATLTLWIGGDPAVLDELEPLLASYASPIMHVGVLGDGQRVKLVNNALFVAQVGLAIDAVRLARSLGLAEQPLLAAVQHGSGASRALGVVARGESVEATTARLSEWMRKDIDVVREVALRAEADLGLLGEVLASELVETLILRR